MALDPLVPLYLIPAQCLGFLVCIPVSSVGQRGETPDSNTKDQSGANSAAYCGFHCASISHQRHIGGGKQALGLLIDVFRQCGQACAAQRQLPLSRYTLHLEETGQEVRKAVK